jgi:hypothetical protein
MEGAVALVAKFAVDGVFRDGTLQAGLGEPRGLGPVRIY